ncbi:MAG: GIY-YIG nuclease family protein [Patescibacteria group bacterium]
MFYCYILLSSRSHKFYSGYTSDLKARIELHNSGAVTATRLGKPWKLVWYGAFSTEKEAKDFERYLKSGSGKALAYKRLVPVALAKDLANRRKGLPKPKA